MFNRFFLPITNWINWITCNWTKNCWWFSIIFEDNNHIESAIVKVNTFHVNEFNFIKRKHKEWCLSDINEAICFDFDFDFWNFILFAKRMWDYFFRIKNCQLPMNSRLQKNVWFVWRCVKAKFTVWRFKFNFSASVSHFLGELTERRVDFVAHNTFTTFFFNAIISLQRRRINCLGRVQTTTKAMM